MKNLMEEKYGQRILAETSVKKGQFEDLKENWKIILNSIFGQ
jgi:hypothetical protein